MSRAISSRIISRRSAVITTLGLVVAPRLVRAQDAPNYPDRPVRVIVSTAAGGGVDAFARIVTQKMSAELGQPFPVENRAGAGGSVGADAVFHSTADGYTLLASQPAPITTNALLLKALDYDPARLEAVVIMSHIPNVLLVRPDFPAKTAQELIAYAKENPGKLNYASQGPGSTSHLTGALFGSITNTKLVHVPYKGTGPAINDLIASRVDLMFNELSTSVELHKSGRARILAVTTKQRVATLPEIPTLAEAGVTGCESDTWNALTAPPNTPAPIIAKLNAAANNAMQAPDLLDRYKQLNATLGGGTLTETAAFIKEETRRWGEVIRSVGIQPE
jgi:tripartite-type tricarboxylate transporter receptor subunit TctC